MKGMTLGATRRLVLLAAALAAGCAGLPQGEMEGKVDVAAIERVAWNTPEEPGLFRVRFDAARSQAIRRRVEDMVHAQDVDFYTAEVRVLEDDALRELKARHLCGGNIKLVTYLDGRNGPGGMGAVFRCFQSLF
jgi:F0F1-type ATP synthase membrane subunit c/vacuolar-type H+-ATPase subunit K